MSGAGWAERFRAVRARTEALAAPRDDFSVHLRAQGFVLQFGLAAHDEPVEPE
jgi:hypothetical protein